MTGAAMAGRLRLADGHDIDHYADDLKAVTDHLDLKDADSCRPFDRRRRGGALSRASWRKHVAKAAIISAVPPLMVKTPANPARPAQRGFRRSPGAARRQPGQVLLRSAGRPVLWLQPSRRENYRADRSGIGGARA